MKEWDSLSIAGAARSAQSPGGEPAVSLDLAQGVKGSTTAVSCNEL